jgi:glycosyltransferase involved in cell wall biosynthesis
LPFAKPLRVGYVVKRYPRFAETFVVSEILAHEAAGLELEIFSLYPPNDTHFQDRLASVRAPVTYLPADGLRAVEFWAGVRQSAAVVPGVCAALNDVRDEEARDVYQGLLLAREVRARSISHLHAHFASVATSVTRIAARFAGVPYSFTAHAKDIFHASVNPDAFRRKLVDAAAVVTVSDYNVAYLGRTYGIAASKVRRIYNGLDFTQLEASSARERPPLIVAVGRLVEKKGFAYLVEACRILSSRGRQFECLIIGTGLQEMALRAQIERLQLASCVRLLGPRPRSEVLRHMRTAAVCAVPCVVGSDGDRDGLPTVLLESMAVGTPCVASDVTAIPEAIRDGRTGFVVPQKDPLALAAACERLLQDSDLRVGIAARARQLVETEFDVRRNSSELRELFLPAMRIRQAAAQRVG